MLLPLALAAPAVGQTPLSVELAASGFLRPVNATAPPGDTERLFVVEKAGVIRIVDLTSASVRATPFLDIDALVGGGMLDRSEQGLLDLAFSPDYANDGFFYVTYTANDDTWTLARYSVSTDPNVADAGSATIVLTVAQPQDNHNGGWLEFGPRDGLLYASLGDGGGAGDTGAGHTPGLGNSQDLSNLMGTIVRLDPAGDDFPADPLRNYAVPASNPFVGMVGEDEIWSYGLRNPWQNAFDAVTGDLWIADVGQSTREEVNFQPAASAGGENYGWRCREGTQPFDTSGDCSQTPFTDPIHEYAHTSGRCSITGGRVYRGCALPDLRGAYFFGDFCTGEIWSLRSDGTSVSAFTDRTGALAPAGGSSFDLVAFGEDASGELYIVLQDSGELWKIVPDAVPAALTLYDYDNDGVVTIGDLRASLACVTGPVTLLDACLCDVFDADLDGDVDLRDLANAQQQPAS